MCHISQSPDTGGTHENSTNDVGGVVVQTAVGWLVAAGKHTSLSGSKRKTCRVRGRSVHAILTKKGHASVGVMWVGPIVGAGGTVSRSSSGG